VGHEIADNYSKERERFFVYDLAPVTEYNIFNSALDFYTERTTPTLRSLDELKGKSVSKATLIYTDEQGLTSLKSSGLRLEILHTYQNFHVTGLTLPFLNPATRSTETHPRYLVRLK
jgi:hypothetical protein